MAYEAAQSNDAIGRRGDGGRAMRILVPLVLVVAVAALVVAIVAFMLDRPKSYAAQIQRIEQHEAAVVSRLSAAAAEITQLKANSEAGAVTSLTNQISGLKSQLAQYKICVPQLQQEITSMNIQSSTQGGFLTNAYIQDPTIVSSNCTALLSGNSH
jgi:hypothetical protein